MADIQIQIDAVLADPAPAREAAAPRSVLAIGWVRFKPAPPRSAGGDQLDVLGMLLVKDAPGARSTQQG
jgi:hypothetical protein